MKRNRTFFTIVILAMAVVLALAGRLPVTVIQAQNDDEDPITRIEAMFAGAAERDDFSGAVVIAQDGEVLLSQGYGFAVREWEVPNTPESVFRIASVTKQFTGMAVLLLQERGLLTVQDPVCQYFEECPEAWADITLHHLLTHTSGIRELWSLPNFWQTQMIRSRPEQTIERFITEPLDFAPGEEWSYSNSGYIVLGYIIEEVSGDSYQTFLRKNIFDPLGMESTAYRSANTTVIAHRAEGYANPNRPAGYLDMSVPYAAGGLHSTVGDLYLWTQALFGGAVVTQQSWDAMVEAAYTMPDGGRYGYGLTWFNVGNHPAVGHGGGIEGFSSMVIHFLEENVTVIILMNLEADPFVYINILSRILFDD